MPPSLPRLARVAIAGCAAVSVLTAADTRKPVTEWLARPSEAARIARVEAGLAPVTLPGAEPQHLSLQRWMELYAVPGLSVAVFEKNALVWAKTYGVKQAGGSEPVTVDTLFQAASISKPVTALAAMRYVEQGKWSLDANINDTLVSWKVPDNEYTKEQKVTLRRLLSHSAGLTVHGFPGYAVSEARPTVQQILDGAKPTNTAAVRVDLVPGTKTRYSGGGTTVVQLMMMDQLKKPFPQIMKEAVLAPLGLKHSSYEQPLPPALAAQAASATRGNGKSIDGKWHVYPEMAAAGLWTTPSDLARIAIEVSKARAGTSKRVVSQAMAKQMLTKQSERFGIGFQLEDGSDRFGHGGSNEGFRAMLVAFADSGSGMALMSNSDNGSFLIERVAASIAAEYGWKSFSSELQESPMMTADLLGRLKGADAVLAWYEARRRDGPADGLSPAVLNQFGYGLLSAGKVPEAVKVFEANVRFYPEDANAYDSLGEAFLAAGRNAEAILHYKKSLELDPKNTHAVKVLERLGARH
ncbi:serine hydrolase domain-containing protein [Myxococcus sp. RHSTA-1-4]|uniref:serine hydrolase domain-containing protein n=1 Tax=Myxococcus sp. RHSTA-1-4 TaxID=2874601 RepID=UPI001CBBC98B|nr:serine hydrolase domain-containing protein [Myxococcus sp. RHSTA-1-4]MBZ4420409.1 serine hydrolase [Myxococcus sp. RHSTA-1-4]